MRNLTPDNTDAIKFITAVIDSKRPRKDPGYKSRCHTLLATARPDISAFNHAFNANALENLAACPTHSTACDDFQKLYSYNSTPFRKLRESIICSDHNRRNNLCPLCEINQVSTLDHFLPKAEFPAYVAHPRNLVPCCTTCNDHKSQCWHTTGNREVWNTYLDPLPTQQYLHCTITIEDDLPKATFSISRGSLPANTFALIERTFTRLHLLDHYSEAANASIATFIRTALAHIRHTPAAHSTASTPQILSSATTSPVSASPIPDPSAAVTDPFSQAIDTLLTITRESAIPNNWESTLHIALLTSPQFLTYLRTHS